MTDKTPATSADIDGIEIEWDLEVPEVRMASDDSLATVLLAGRLGTLGARPLKASEYWSLLKRLGVRMPWKPPPGRGAAAADGGPDRPGEGPSVLLGKSAEELVGDFGVPEGVAGRVEVLTASALSLAFELERLEQTGIRTLTAFDEHYPQRWLERLGTRAPPLVYGAGAVELLDTAGLGVVGSRDVSEAGGEAAMFQRSTALEETLLTFCPPGPELRANWKWISRKGMRSLSFTMSMLILPGHQWGGG